MDNNDLLLGLSPTSSRRTSRNPSRSPPGSRASSSHNQQSGNRNLVSAPRQEQDSGEVNDDQQSVSSSVNDQLALAQLNSNPHGRIMVRFYHTLTSITALLANSKIAATIPTPTQMAADFEQAESESRRITSAQVTNAIQGKQTNFCVLSPIHIDPPLESSYSPHPSLNTDDVTKQNLVKLYFNNKIRFTGEKTKNGEHKHASIQTVLLDLTFAQNAARVSLEEFIFFMGQRFYGESSRVFTTLSQNCTDVKLLYTKLLRMFFTDEYPRQAEDKLLDIKLGKTKFSNFQSLVAEIMRLARLKSYGEYEGIRRTICFELVSQDTLMGAIPDSLTAVVQAEVARVKAERGGNLNFDELQNVISGFAAPIDSELEKLKGKEKHGKNSLSFRGQTRGVRGGGRGGRGRGQRGGRQGRVNAITHEESREEEQSERGQQQRGRRRGKNNGRGQNSYRGGNKSRGYYGGGYQGNNYNKKDTRQINCLLCIDELFDRNKAHATEDCPNFLQAERIAMASKCTKCNWGRYHLEAACPMERAKAARPHLTPAQRLQVPVQTDQRN